MTHRLRAAHLALLLVALTAPAAASSGLADGLGQQRTPTPADTPAVDQTTILVELQSNGDARWMVTAYFNVTTATERESFNETAERFTDGEAETLGLSAFRRATDLASDATGRTMNVTRVQHTSDSNVGSLTLSFTWTNFARVEDEVLYVDDVYNTSEPWLSGLEEDQRLAVELPPEAGVRSAPKRVQNGRIVWDGPTTFEPSDLALAYSPGGPITTTTAPGAPNGSDSPTTPGGSGSPNGDGDGNPVLWGGFFVVGLGIAVLSVYMLSMRDGGPFDGAATATTAPDEDDGDQPATNPTSDAEPTEPEQDDDGIDEELLSDEERVERLLDRNGGRMKQANIVKETGWSNAKVSQLLSAMEEDGQIDKLRIGRENLISFPDEDVTDIED